MGAQSEACMPTRGHQRELSRRNEIRKGYRATAKAQRKEGAEALYADSRPAARVCCHEDEHGAEHEDKCEGHRSAMRVPTTRPDDARVTTRWSAPDGFGAVTSGRRSLIRRRSCRCRHETGRCPANCAVSRMHLPDVGA